MSNVKCPICDLVSPAKDRVETNVEMYGSNELVDECRGCGTMLRLYLVRTVKYVSVEVASPMAESSF